MANGVEGQIVLGLNIPKTTAEIQSGIDKILRNTKTRQIVLRTAIEKSETEKSINALVEKLNKNAIKLGVEISAKDVQGVLIEQQKIASKQAELNRQMQEYRDIAKTLGITLNKSTWNTFNQAIKAEDFSKAKDIIKSAKQQIDEYNQAVRKMNADTSVSGSVDVLVHKFNQLSNVSSDTQNRINLLRANLKQFETADSTKTKLAAYNRLKKLIVSLTDDFKNLSFVEKSSATDSDLRKKIVDATSALAIFETKFQNIGDGVEATKVTAAIDKLRTALDSVNDKSTGRTLQKQWESVENAVNSVNRAVAEYNAISGIRKSDSSIMTDFKDAQTYFNSLKKIYSTVEGATGASLTKALEELNTALTTFKTSSNSLSGAKLAAEWDKINIAIQNVNRSIKEYNSEQSVVGKLDTSLTSITDKIETAIRDVGNSHASGEGVDELNKRLTDLLNKANKLRTTLSTLDPSNGESIKHFQEEVKNLKTEFHDLHDDVRTFGDGNAFSQFTQNVEKARQKVAEYDKTYSAIKNRKDLVSELNQLRETAENIKTPAQLKEWNAAFEQFNTKVKTAGLHCQSLGDKLKTAFKNFASFFSASRIIYEAINSVKLMIDNIKALDAAMIELRKVTNESDKTYERFLGNAQKRAVELGTSVKDLVNATADFARLGFTIKEAEELAEVATIYANVGDGVGSIDQATSSLISTMKAFGIESENAMTIVDKFNEIGNNFAISSGGIGDALQRSAAALKAAGNDIDESIALIVAANNVIQDADTVGTMWKTVSMRIRGATTELEAAGLETELMAKSTSDLRDTIMAITNINGKGGFDILADDGNFKGTYDIILGIAKVWEELGKTDPIGQSALLELLAGKRQSNALAAALTNMEDLVKVLETSRRASDGMGSAMEEYSKYLEGIEGKTNQFKAAFESLSLTLVNSNLFKNLIDGGTTLITVIDDIIKKLGGLGNALLNIAGIITMLSPATTLNALGTGISLIGKFTGLSKLVGIFKDISASGLTAGQVVKNLIAQISGAATAGTVALGVIGAIITAITAAIAISKAIARRNEEIKKTAEEAAQAIKDIAKSYQELNSSAADVIPRFAELAKGVNKFGENVSLTDEEYKEFLSINNQLAEMFPELNLGLDSNGNAMLALSYSADTLTESLWNLVEAQRQASYQSIAEKMPDVLKGIKVVEKEYDKEIEKVKESIEEWKDFYNDFLNQSLPSSTGTYGSSSTAQKVADEMLDKANFLGIHGGVTTPQRDHNGGYTVYFQWDYENYDYDSLKKMYDTKLEEHDKLINNYKNMIAAKWNEVNASVSAWVQTDYLYNDLNNQMQKIVMTMVSGLDFNSLGLDTEKKIQDYITNYIIKPLFKSTPSVKNAFAKITDLRNELKNGDISQAEFTEKLKEAFDSLLSTMNADEISKFKEAFINGYNEIEIAGDDFDTVVNNLIAEWGNFSDQIGDSTAIDANVQALNTFRNVLNTLKTATEEYNKTGNVSTDTYNKIIDLNKDYADIFDFSTGKIVISTNALQKHIDKLVAEYGATLAANGASEDQIKTLAALAGALSKVTTETEVTTSSLKSLVDIYSDAADGTELSTLAVLDLIEQYPELIGAIEQTATGYKLEESAVRNLIVEKANLYKINESLAKQAAREKLDKITNNKGKTSATVDKIFEEYYADTGKQIKTFDEYITAWEKHFNRSADSAKWVSGLKEYVDASIDEAKRLATIDMLLNDLKSSDPTRWKIETNSSNKQETEFEKAYKNHQHLLAMDKENIADYLKWLNSAYQAAYDAGQIELDDYYKYQEEVYSKTKELFDDVLNDSEHQISLLSRHDGNTDKIVKIYKELQDAVHEQAEKYRAAGLDDNHELIQELQNQWWDYYDAIRDKMVESYEELANNSQNQITLTETLLNNAIAEGDYTQVRKHSETIIAEYRKMQEVIHDEAEYYRSLGYLDTSNEVSKLSDLWWDYYDAIVEAASAGFQELVDNANSALDEVQNVYTTLKNAAQEQADSGFITVDTMQEILSLGANYLAYLKDENGQLVINEENIHKVIAARTQQVAVETSLNYIQQLRTALNNQDTESLNNLIYATENATNSTWDLVYAQLAALNLTDDQYNTALQRIDAIRSLADNAVTSIGQVTGQIAEQLQQSSDALDNILKYTIELIKQEVNNQVDALKQQVKQYQDIVNLQKESLNLAREKDKYDRNVADKVNSIAKLEAKIQKLSLDDSREAKAEQAKLQEELAKLQEELSDYQADHAYDTTVNSLDKMAEAYEDEKNKEIEILEDSISSYEKVYQLAIDRINNQWDTLYQDLIDWNTRYGNDTNETLTNAWNNASAAVQQYGSYLAAVKATQESFNVSAGTSSSGGGISSGSLTLGTSNDYSADALKGRQVSSLVQKMKANSTAWWNASSDERGYLENENNKLAAQIESILGKKLIRGADGVWYIGNIGSSELLYEKYHKGGIVGGGTLKDNEQIAVLEKGEVVLDKAKKETAWEMLDENSKIHQISSLLMPILFGTNGNNVANRFFDTQLDNTAKALSQITTNNNNYVIEKIEVPTQIQVVERLDKNTIREHAETIGEISADYISEGFTRSGIGSGVSVLKGR